MATFPRPGSPSPAVPHSRRRASLSSVYTSNSPVLDEQFSPTRLAGPLFAPSSPTFVRYGTSAPSSCFPSKTPRPIQRQSYYTFAHKDELPHDDDMVPVASPKTALKSCLKSPQFSNGNPSCVKSPRFAPLPMATIKSRNEPLWNDEVETAEPMYSFATSKNPYGLVNTGEAPGWTSCRERVPTPFQRARGSEILNGQQSGESTF
ncbi:SubName: Full=Uncharacterized protein {ECO:0000313/EMBL:CCA68768.1} [Serendipita indica DSM 11827]|uniref:Uncharacterized protein n=1 Tax=Serendipita indica (strain DSM 11827) TaxID=1109443 RepID=G4TBS5_SERID|nr:SubName: Full=Uncharacterized protein {ECO:0000313/EMBL:CCA68768.1} [Serendipita indica DSM 11827]CCA68768.1 hypothetical protein PIIN_02630 [Serendipita indica DSM 11827]